MVNPVHLILKHQYFNAIKSGEKTIEYRENTPYWRKRICGIKRDGSDQAREVIFHKGYTNKTIHFKIDYIVLREKIEIHLGRKIS